jgi:hypothetical protein
VNSTTTGEIEVPAYGLVKPVSPDSPAEFDLIADRAGAFVIRSLPEARLVGRISVLRRGAR